MKRHTNKSHQRKIRRAWKYSAIVLTLGWLIIGCNPITMTEFLIMPWANHNIAPKYSITKKKDDPKLIVMVQFENGIGGFNQLNADRDLNARLVQTLKHLYKENDDEVTVVPITQVRAYLNRNAGRYVTKQELGKHFDADYVLNLDIHRMKTIEGGSMLRRGRADITVTLIDVHQPDGEGTIVAEPYNIVYPKSGPRDASDISAAQFQAIFLQRVARDIAKNFAAYPKEWRYREMD